MSERLDPNIETEEGSEVNQEVAAALFEATHTIEKPKQKVGVGSMVEFEFEGESPEKVLIVTKRSNIHSDDYTEVSTGTPFATALIGKEVDEIFIYYDRDGVGDKVKIIAIS